MLFTIQTAPGPQGDGLQGSGFSMHFWFWHMNPVLQSGSRTHSGPQPVMVSGLGTSPGSHLKSYNKKLSKCKLLESRLESFLPANWISNVVYHTNSSWSTGWRIAWVWFFHTALSLAYVTWSAVCIDNTFWTTACDGVRLGNQASLTSNYRRLFFNELVGPNKSFENWLAMQTYRKAFLMQRLQKFQKENIDQRKASIER